MGDWIPRLAATVSVILLALSAPVTVRRWRQSNLDRLLAVISRLDDSPAAASLKRQAQKDAKHLAAMYAVTFPKFLFGTLVICSAYLAVASTWYFAIGGVNAGLIDRGSAFVSIPTIAVAVYAGWSVHARVGQERKRYIDAGCPDYFPHTYSGISKKIFRKVRLQFKAKTR